jgi:hypothetical protein
MRALINSLAFMSVCFAIPFAVLQPAAAGDEERQGERQGWVSRVFGDTDPRPPRTVPSGTTSGTSSSTTSSTANVKNNASHATAPSHTSQRPADRANKEPKSQAKKDQAQNEPAHVGTVDTHPPKQSVSHRGTSMFPPVTPLE